MNERPLINDTPGKPAHPMTDEQYAEYLRMQEEMEKMPKPEPSPEERLAAIEQTQMEQDMALMELAEMLGGASNG